MSDTRIFVEFSFDAAHRLPNVPSTHKCGRMHGHTYRLTLWFAGPLDPVLGWVIDYAMVKAAADAILVQLDHHTLNEVEGLENPTCELIAAWLAQRLNVINFGTARLVEVEVRETERAGVRLTVEPPPTPLPGTPLSRALAEIEYVSKNTERA